MNEDEAKRLVADAGRMLLDEGLTARTWGNISYRTDDDRMVITPSGLGYEGMTPDDVVPVDMETGLWEGARKPSSEKAVHIAAYRALTDARFVIHTHQTYASALGLAGFPSLVLTAEEKSALGGVALAGYALPGTAALARNISEKLRGGAHTVLMAHHGALIAGKNRSEAFERAQLLEAVCRRACKGQPEETPVCDEALAKRLTDLARSVFGHVARTAASPVLACAEIGKSIPAQLDDTAQSIGARLPAVKPEGQAVILALGEKDVVLVPGVGALCRASTDGDLHALCLLAEKACVCRLHTRALGVSGRLSWLDTELMRVVFLKKYSKKIGG